MPADRREADGAAAEVGEASSDRVLAAPPPPVVVGEAVVAVAPLGEVERVEEVEAAAQQQGDPTKVTTTTKSRTPGGMSVRPSDPPSSSPRTFPVCMHSAKRPDTRSMRRDVTVPR